jgi:hypothetical protein
MREHTRDLRQLEETLASFDPGHAERFVGVRLMQQSLERRREQILSEIHGTLRVGLTRSERAGTGAELPLVAGVLSALQESLASIAQVMAGKPTARGLIPAAIKQEVELRVAEAQPGSLNLRLVPAAPSHEPLFQDGEGSLLELSVDRLLGLLAHAHGDRGDLLQDIADLGPRVTSHVQALSNWIAEGQATAALEWRSRGFERSARLDTRAAAQLRDVLREVDEEKRDLVFTGRLVGGSLVRRTFELELELEPPETSVIGGRVDEDALPALEALSFGQSVTATVEVRESRLRSGETRESHLLKSVSA